MKITVVCAAGKQGSMLVREALSRGHAVTAVVRDAAAAPAGADVLVRDLFDLTREDLAGSDVVIDAFGAWTPETLPQHSTSLLHLCDLLSGKQARLLVVGGAGSLYTDAAHTACLAESPDFPEAFKPLAAAMAEALAALRKREDVRWTYLSPAADFHADGEKTGRYCFDGEELTLNARGESAISYADYAAAMLDEAERGEHIRQRISVVGA